MANHKKNLPQLFLYEKSSNPLSARLIAKDLYNVSAVARVKPVKDLNDLGVKINAEQKITHLILSFHGYRGGIMIDGHLYDLDGNAVKKALSVQQGRSIPDIDKIDFFGCDIGKKPSNLQAFGNIYGASQVSAYTWPIVHQLMKINIPKGTSIEEIRKQMSPYREYTLGFRDPAQIAAQAQRKDIDETLILVYGSENGSTTTFPLSFGQKFKYKALSEAKITEIKSSNAKKSDADYDSPVVFFERVTVKLK